MDNDQQAHVIEARLDALDGMTISDDRSARVAFTHVMATVSLINQLSARTRAQAMVGAGAPVDDLLDRLEQWLDRILRALPRIVDRLAGATSFSISVGTNVSLTVVFGHSEPQDHSVREISE
jgi:hypothetical protein